MFVIKAAKISTGVKNKTRIVDIFVSGEKITAIEPAGKRKFSKGTKVINARGLLALPGAIDPHVHFDTPGFTTREDFAHGTRAAAAGGVTTVIDMPDTSLPPVTSVAALNKKLCVIEKMAYVDFALWGGISKNEFLDGKWDDVMNELKDAGVVGFKTYLLSGMKTFPQISFMELGQVLQKSKELDVLIGVHAESPKTYAHHLSHGHGNPYYESRRDPVEFDGISDAVGLANFTKGHLHIVHLGSGEGCKLIRRMKDVGLDITTETCPQYLTFTHDDFKKYGSLIKTAPVVKESSDRDTLMRGVIDGTIDFLATDHAPCTLKEKHTGDIIKDYGGMPGVELLLPFAFSELYKKKKITLARLIEIISTNAAKRFGLYPRKGILAVGSDADIVLIDENKKCRVDAKKMHSKAKWTPFNGKTLTGKVVSTFVRGTLVYEKNELVGEKVMGKWIIPFKVIYNSRSVHEKN